MKFYFIYTLPMLLALLLAACERQDFTQPASPTQPDTPILITDSTMTVHTIEEAQAIFKYGQDTTIHIKGYIVGTATGTQLASAQFQPPFTNSTNILLASSRYETVGNNCFPVRLEKDSYFRNTLNLMEHPELHHRAIIITGKLEKYFATCGIKTIQSFQLVESASDSTSQSTTDKHDSIPILQQGTLINGGR